MVVQKSLDLGIGAVNKFLPFEIPTSISDKIMGWLGLAEKQLTLEDIKKDLVEITNGINKINTQLQEIVELLQRKDSEKAMITYYNTAQNFFTVVTPKFAGLNELIMNGASDEECKTFYDQSLKNLNFGGGTSSGSLYANLSTLLRQTVKPLPHGVPGANTQLLEHFHNAYEHLWAFDMQEFLPKMQLINYASTIVIYGLTLYNFETSIKYKYKLINQTELETEYNLVKKLAETAMDYLKKQNDFLISKEKNDRASNTTIHRRTNSLLARELIFESFSSNRNKYRPKGAGANSLIHYIRSKKFYKRKVDNDEYKAIDCSKLITQVMQDFKAYRVNYKRPKLTLKEFLQDCGFTAEVWPDEVRFYEKMQIKYTVAGDYDYFDFNVISSFVSENSKINGHHSDLLGRINSIRKTKYTSGNLTTIFTLFQRADNKFEPFGQYEHLYNFGIKLRGKDGAERVLSMTKKFIPGLPQAMW